MEERLKEGSQRMLTWMRRRPTKVIAIAATLWLVVYVMTYLAGPCTAWQTADVLKYINPLVGTLGPGHCFGGPSLPYAMVKPVADTTENNRGGFAYDGQLVTGFSHMHDTGIGGGSAMGNFPLFPMPPCAGNIPDGCAPFKKRERALPWINDSVVASPGYFSIELDNEIRTEITSSSHAALYRFTYRFVEFGNATYENATARQMFVLVDLTDLYDSKNLGYIEVDHVTGRIHGHGNYMSSFGNSGRYESFFCADFSGAPLISAGIWQGDATLPNASNLTAIGRRDAGAYVQFFRPAGVDHLYARVGMSLISVEQACDNAENEIPTPYVAFDELVDAQEDAWRAKLNVIKVDPGGVSEDLQTTFWSGVYRNLISPQNYTGENPNWSDAEPYYDSFYCLWDSFRAQFPLLAVLDPGPLEDMIRSLVDVYEHEGYLPDCRMQLNKGITQGGSNAEVVIADWAVKMGLTPGINWTRAYEGMVKDAEVQPTIWLVEGRGHLESYKELGYIPQDDARSSGRGLDGAQISRTVEYAYDDFCIAEVAKLMNKTDDYEKYVHRSGNYKNMFRHDQRSVLPNGTDTSFTGFLQPRLSNGSWAHQEPARGSPADWEHCCGMFGADLATYEGSSWSYTFYLPGDGAQLVALLGGDDEFVRRLDYMHENDLLDIGDEQAFLPIFQYHYAGRPGRSTYRAHSYIPSAFNSSLDGIPGNDDSGAMGAFVVFAMIGLFPVAGQNVYLITAPFFPEVRVTSPVTGKTARIVARNWDAGYENMYIQRARLNGRAWTRSWLDHSFFLDGGTLEVWLGAWESLGVRGWGTRMEDRPPSLSTTGVYLP